MRLVIATIILLSAVMAGCGDDPAILDENNDHSQHHTSATALSDTATRKTIPYLLMWENDEKRYDHAPTIVIITDSNTHSRMHGLVDQYARKISSKKFTLVVFDDKNAGYVYKQSHYAANDVRRIATKTEMLLMDKHIVGTYIGELGTNGDPYEISYHGFGFGGDSHEEYEPKL